MALCRVFLLCVTENFLLNYTAVTTFTYSTSLPLFPPFHQAHIVCQALGKQLKTDEFTQFIQSSYHPFLEPREVITLTDEETGPEWG